MLKPSAAVSSTSTAAAAWQSVDARLQHAATKGCHVQENRFNSGIRDLQLGFTFIRKSIYFGGVITFVTGAHEATLLLVVENARHRLRPLSFGFKGQAVSLLGAYDNHHSCSLETTTRFSCVGHHHVR